MNENYAQLYRQIVQRRISQYLFSDDNLFDFRQILNFMYAQTDRPAKRSDPLAFAVSATTVFEAIYESIHRDAKAEFDALVEDLNSAQRATSGEGGDSGGASGEVR